MPRPRVLLNAAMSLDGKIATIAGDTRFSGPEDLVRIHQIRAEVDAIMVGVNTVLKDDPLLTNRSGRGKTPLRVIVDSLARTPVSSRVVKTQELAPTLISVTSVAPPSRVESLRSAGVKVFTAGEGPGVDLNSLLERLREDGVEKLLLEGGGNLNWSMLSQGLVDEISVAIAPTVVGGVEATSFVGGTGYSKVDDAPKLKLKKIETVGYNVVLFFDVSSLGKPVLS